MEGKISIIIPVYKVEKYVERCIKCIQDQTYTNWEAIFVEDGSPDRSGEICDRYAAKDERIKVVHKENEGVAAARNTGLANVTGEYIAFIDSDDYAHPKYLEVLMKLLTENDADLAICGYELSMGSHIGEGKALGELEIMNSSQAVAKIIENQQFCSPWSKLYKKRLFEHITYPEGAIYEDLGTAFEIFQAADKIVYQNIPLYYYFQVSESITRSEFHYGKLDEAKALKHQYEFVREHFPELKDAAKYKYLYNVYGHILCLVKMEDEFGKRKYEEFCSILNNNMAFFRSYQPLGVKQRFRCAMIKHPQLYRTYHKLTKKI